MQHHREEPAGSDLPRSARIVRLLDPLALLAAAGLTAATVAALCAKAWWGFELFSHFRPQYAALQLPLCAALFALGRRRVAAALALALVPNVWPLVPYLSGAAPAIAAGGKPIVLLSANVEWRNTSSERLLEMIRAESPDAVLVVEYTESWRERLEPLFASYPHRVLRPSAPRSDDEGFGIALLSRLPLRDARVIRLESTAAIDATLVAAGGELRLIGVHLRPPTSARWAAERNRQLDALARLVDETDGPLAVAGDFNLSPYSPYFSELLRAARLRDSRAGSGPDFTWPSFLPVLGIPIDHVLVTPEVRGAAYRRLGPFGSDHYPIVVELTF